MFCLIDCYKKQRLNPHFRELIKSRTIFKKKNKRNILVFSLFPNFPSDQTDPINHEKISINEKSEMEERKRDRSVQRGGRHAKFSEKRNRAFRSVELEFYGVIIAIFNNM